jgi:hypothetical protein
MKLTRWQLLACVIVWAVSVISFAQAPLGATGQCNDGSYSMMDSKQAACGKHGGVKEWYRSNRAPDTSANAHSSAAARTGVPRSGLAPRAGKSPDAAGGGPEFAKAHASKGDHCDKPSGKTTKGKTTNADAKADNAAHGRACS